jgi:Amt family ammonium transporter
MVFCATTASIVSGTLAERIKLWPFLIFTAVLTGVHLPDHRFLAVGRRLARVHGLLRLRRLDAGALGRRLGRSAGAIILGARKGKYGADGKVTRCRVRTCRSPRSVPSSCGSAGSASTAHRSSPWARIGDASDISRIFANTNLAAVAGVVAAMILTQILYKKVDVTMALNGALAGLVSITAEPLLRRWRPSSSALSVV